MSVSDVAPGRTYLDWNYVYSTITRGGNAGPAVPIVPPGPIKVKHGDRVQIDLGCIYTGAQTLNGLSISIAASPLNPTDSKKGPFLVGSGKTVFTSQEWALIPPESDCPPLTLIATIPDTYQNAKTNVSQKDRRTEYNATVQVTAGSQRLGPLLRLRFVIEKPK
jgi:hypothetical protein